MKYGVILLGKDEEIVAMAQEAEAAGWNGIFLPDDWGASWIRLTAIAMSTTRLRLGTMWVRLTRFWRGPKRGSWAGGKS